MGRTVAVHDAPSRPALPPELDPRRPPHPRASGRGRLAQLLLGALSALVLVVSVGGYVVVQWFDGTIARLHLDLGSGSTAADGTSNWVLVGTDSRAGTGNEYGGTKTVGGQRSDTTILAHLDKDGTTTMVSIPRDTYVTIPAYDDAKGKHQAATRSKFNSAIETGGPALLVSTLERFTGLPIDHYVSVDLAGFKRVTDAVGGVTVCLKQSSFSSNDANDAGTASVHSTNTNDPFSGWKGGPGTLHVNGDQALAFVRQRHGLPEGDINRIQRQQQFLGSVFRSATGKGTLFNPARVTSLLFSVRDALSLDEGTSSSDLEALAERLKGTSASKVVFTTLPVRGLRQGDPGVTSNGSTLVLGAAGSVEVYDQKTLDAFLAPLRGESPTPSPSASASVATPRTVAVPPARVQVEVRNGTTQSGLARRVSTGLAQLHFRSSIGPDKTAGPTASEVRYATSSSTDRAAAATVAAAVPGSVVRADASLSPGTVVLVVGSSYTRLQPVRTQGQAAPKPAAPVAPATPSAPPVTADSAGNRCTL